jgi:hypothetical protein
MLSPMHQAPVAELAELAAGYSEAWGSHDLEAIVERHSRDGVCQLHAVTPPVVGRPAIHDTFAALFAQIPDVAFANQELLFAEWGWVLRSTITGTMAAPLTLGPATAPAGHRISMDAVDVVQAQGGLITVKRTYADWLTPLTELLAP